MLHAHDGFNKGAESGHWGLGIVLENGFEVFAAKNYLEEF